MDFRSLVRGSLRETRAGYLWGFGVLFFLMAYVVVTPSISLVPGLEPYNEKRALQIGVLFLTSMSLLASSKARSRCLSTFQALPSVAYQGLSLILGLGVLSSALAPDPFAAFLELSHFLLLFFTAGIVAAAVRSSSKFLEAILLGSIVLGATVYTVGFFVGYGTMLSLQEIETGRETISGFANVRFFNQYQTWTLPLLAGAVIAVPREWRAVRGTAFVLVGFWWTLVLASNVRGTVVSVFVAAVGVWVLFRDRSYRWLGVQVAALLLGGAFYYFLFTSGGGAAPQVVERLGEVGQSRRLQHWAKCLSMAWADPWLGVGPMHYAWPSNDFAPAAHPHNAFFQWLAEWGTPSTALMSGLIVWGGWQWMQQERGEAETASSAANGVRVSLVASVLAGTAHAMVSGIIVMPVSQVLLVLIGGWAWGRHQRGSSASAPETLSFQIQTVFCAILVASVVVVGASLHNLTTTEERREAFTEAADRDRLSPRYWTQGYLNVRDSGTIRRSTQ